MKDTIIIVLIDRKTTNVMEFRSVNTRGIVSLGPKADELGLFRLHLRRCYVPPIVLMASVDLSLASLGRAVLYFPILSPWDLSKRLRFGLVIYLGGAIIILTT